MFWTDSEVVLGYISNDARRFHTFVANRVQSIREYTTPDQWRKVHTKENPADKASRGLSAQELLSSHSWWNGPEFLRRPLNEQVGREEPATISDSDPEVRKVHSLAIKVEPFANLIERLQYFSDWNRARRAVALPIRLQKRYKGKQANREAVKEKRGSNITEPISVEEICQAELEIIRTVQREAFPREMKLRPGMPTQERAEERSVRKASVISQLDPFADETGVLRVGGRIKHAGIPFKEKHPLILPKKGHVTNLIIRHHHEEVCHQGRGITHARIRSSGVWIVNGSSSVGHLIAGCVTCRRLRGSHVRQKMANLPKDRLEEVAPFTYSAVDYFGPFCIKEGRKELKRYGVIFTCMSTRAIHLETATSLTTDSFLNAY